MDSELYRSFLNERSFFILSFFICGSIFGSFLNCLSMRIVNKEDFLRSRSHCDVCGHGLQVLDLIPILSYIVLKGRCRYCRHRLPPTYPLSEAVLGVVFVLTYLHYGKIKTDLFFDLNLFCIVYGLSLIDLRSYIIPDLFILAGILNWLLRSLFTGLSLTRLLSASFLSLMIYALSLFLDRATGKENLGGGDIKLIFLAGLHTGLIKGVLLLLFSSLFGLTGIGIGKNKKIPFGPYIGFALFLVMNYGDVFLKVLEIPSIG
ncbi:MAG: prepilin peptidase [Erysipelotrichaceae bacterium]|nr:prepilin peptidase [Erysipelotrichaceae bacterium]